MRHFTITTVWLVILAFVLAGIPGQLWADSPSFHFANASASGLDLSVSFKETGLGTTATAANITVNADATATYLCFNGGGNHPKATNKETVSGPVTGGGNFSVRNGGVTGTITVSLPGPGTFSCPSGQTLALSSGTFSNITITDNTESDGPVATTPSSISVP
jgi:hypothetical protein